jgi:hypothetical protein
MLGSSGIEAEVSIKYVDLLECERKYSLEDVRSLNPSLSTESESQTMADRTSLSMYVAVRLVAALGNTIA